jgi:iron(III) transport system permease protein
MLFTLASVPLVPLLGAAREGVGLNASFASALARGLMLASLSSLLAFVLGWPAGTLAALYRVPPARAAQVLLLLPLLVPSFVWALAWADAGRAMGFQAPWPGMVLAHAGATLGLVVLTSRTAALTLTASQRDALRLAGGEPTLQSTALRHTAGAAALVAAFGALVVLSDPGPALVFGVRTAAYEVLTSFASSYDSGLAGRQCLALLGTALVLAVPFVWLAAPHLAHVLLERVPALAPPTRHPGGGRLTALALGGACLIVLPPLVVLAVSTWAEPAFETALDDLRRTGIDTVFYSAAAALVAVGLGGAAVLAAGRSRRTRFVVLATALILLAIPPAATALGMLELASRAPAALDPFVRGRFLVGLTLGLRLAPVAALLGLRAFASLPPTWSEAASLHGIGLGSFLSRVVLPWVRPALAAAAVLVALLAAADAPTVLLLHPPGHPSLPLALLTVMSNAPKAYVSALVAVYVGGALLVLGLGLGRDPELRP